MKNIYKPSLLLLFGVIVQIGFGQTVSVPMSHWVYDVLERWEVCHFINSAMNGAKPYTRQETAQYISEVAQSCLQKPQNFSKVDREQLLYLLVEFQEELKEWSDLYGDNSWSPRLVKIMKRRPLNILRQNIFTNGRNFLEIKHEDFHLYTDPVINVDSRELLEGEQGKFKQNRLSNGLLFRGSLGKYLGFYFNLTDNHVKDQRWKEEKIPFQVLEESGLPYLTGTGNGTFDYDENIAYLTFNHKFLYFLYGREFNQWGFGHNGNLLLSTNAQPYDQLKLVIRYWRFKLTHITSFIQYISPENRAYIKASSYIDTYWSGNRLDMNITKGLKFGINEAVVYGGRSLQLGYLNPLAFFKSLEHYYGDRDNSLISLDFEWCFIPGIKIFGEWLIDDITTGKLTSKFYGNKFGWQSGIFVVNPVGIADLDFLLEYTRIKPYVYTQSYQDYNKYKHYDTIFGHFIGPNSDDLYMRIQKRFSKYLQISAEYEKYRHGSNSIEKNVGGDPDRAWTLGDSPEVNFLDGITTRQSAGGISVSYEFIRNFIGEIHYRQVKYNEKKWQSLVSFRVSLNFGYRKEKFKNIFPINH